MKREERDHNSTIRSSPSQAGARVWHRTVRGLWPLVAWIFAAITALASPPILFWSSFQFYPWLALMRAISLLCMLGLAGAFIAAAAWWALLPRRRLLWCVATAATWALMAPSPVVFGLALATSKHRVSWLHDSRPDAIYHVRISCSWDWLEPGYDCDGKAYVQAPWSMRLIPRGSLSWVDQNEAGCCETRIQSSAEDVFFRVGVGSRMKELRLERLY